MALSAARTDTHYSEGWKIGPFTTGSAIYKGGLVCVKPADGYLYAAADTSTYLFAGVAVDDYDSGDTDAEVVIQGVIDVTCSGIAVTDNGSVAYISDDETVVTSGASNDVECGLVYYDSTDTARLVFDVRNNLDQLLTAAEIETITDGITTLIHTTGDAADVKTYTDADTDLYPMVTDTVRVFDIADKANVAILAANTHPDMKLIGGRVTLLEAPDSSADTITFRVYRTSDDADMTDLLTFTEGTDAANDVKDFTVDGTDHTIEDDDAAYITVGGTSSTLGQGLLRLTWQFSR